MPVEKRIKQVLNGKLPKPGEGPNFEVRKSGMFEMQTVASKREPLECITNKHLSFERALECIPESVKVNVLGGDPATDETVRMSVETAILLTRGMGVRYGVMSAISALGDVLVDHLVMKGLKIEEGKGSSL